MKKLLLLGVAALTAASAMAAEPIIVENSQVSAVAPRGQFFVSEIYGELKVINMADGAVLSEWGSYEEQYSVGYGRCISLDGTIVGATPYCAAYLKNDEWTELNVLKEDVSNYAHGITPDGKLIVGTVGTSPITTDDTEEPMMIPAIWELQEDGTYSDCKVLPYPALDFTGRVPQYVMAVSPNNDGTKIAGYVQDYSGFFTQPIVFYRKANGEWEYKIDNSFCNPNNLTFPPYPGDCPDSPNFEDFMTEEEYNAYQDAISEWYASLGQEEMPEFPDFLDFMTEEEINNYNAALAAYEVVKNEWKAKYDAFSAVLEQCQLDGHSIQMNNIIVTPAFDKIYSTTTYLEENPDSWTGVSEIYTPIIIDIETLDYQILAAANIFTIAASDNGTILGFKNESFGRSAHVYLPGSNVPITIADYFETANPETAAWIPENMTHEIEIFDFETWETYTETATITGTPFCNDDLSIMVTGVQNSWDWSSDVSYYSYILPGAPSGVKTVADEAVLKVNALKGGRLLVTGNATDVTVYDTNGAIVFRSESGSPVIETGLASGAYIVKVNSKDDSKVMKVIF